MANDTQRDKARAIFGKAFFENSKPQAQPKNSMAALQQRANARPIPTFKDGGVIDKKAAAGSRRAIRAEQDFSKPMMEAAMRAEKKGMPVMKQGGPTEEYMAKRVRSRMEAGNYKDGGSVDKYKAKLDRKMADIEKDYRIALAKGKSDSIAKAKYEQRMADARDDYAKWTKGDRTQTKAAERAAESALSEARRTKGASIVKRDAQMVAAQPAKSLEATPEIGIKPISIGTAAPKAKAKVRSAAKPAARAVRGLGASAVRKADYKPSAGLERVLSTKPQMPARSQAGAATTSATPAKKVQTAADYRTKRAAELEAKAAEMKKLESAPTGTPGSAWARLKNVVGFGSSGALSQSRGLRGQNEATAKIAESNTRAAAQKAQAQAARKADYLKRASEARAKGQEANAKFYEREAQRLKKGGEVGKYAVGGAGKVRKGMMKGK